MERREEMGRGRKEGGKVHTKLKSAPTFPSTQKGTLTHELLHYYTQPRISEAADLDGTRHTREHTTHS